MAWSKFRFKARDGAVFVSKRLQPAAAAVLCLMAMQLLHAALAGAPGAPLPPGAVRVAIAGR